MAATPGALGVLVNPMSGRDVRRLAARAAADSPDAKRNQVQRILVGAAAAGVERVVLARDLFRISERAVDSLELGIELRFADLGRLETRASDTLRAVAAMREAGCTALVALGGDGTQRLVARAWPEATLLPLSTGTNNVFPVSVEATLAGAAAGLVAAGRLSADEVARPAKLVRARFADGEESLGVIDGVLLEGDHLGSLLPFDPAGIRRVVLARAEPASVGMSPLGGLLLPASAEDDFGVEVCCTPPGGGGRPLLVPVSPGLYRTAHVASARRLALGERCVVTGPGLVEFDGDRERALAPGERAELWVERTGPRVIEVARALALAAERGLYRDRPHGPEPGAAGGGFSCCGEEAASEGWG